MSNHANDLYMHTDADAPRLSWNACARHSRCFVATSETGEVFRDCDN